MFDFFLKFFQKGKEISFCSELINKIFTHYEDPVKRILNIICFMFQKSKFGEKLVDLTRDDIFRILQKAFLYLKKYN